MAIQRDVVTICMFAEAILLTRLTFKINLLKHATPEITL